MKFESTASRRKSGNSLTKPDILQIKLHTETQMDTKLHIQGVWIEDTSAFFRGMDVEKNICEEEVQSGNTK